MSQIEDWQFTRPFFSKALQDGSRSRPFDLLMRRHEDGRWLYRRPTQDEVEVWTSLDAW